MKKIEPKKHEVKESKALALHYMKTLVDVARESFLILDSHLRVIEANPIFYDTFKVTPSETQHKLLYELGNGQWDIAELRKLLEKILPGKKEVRDYGVTHTFEKIGKKTIQLNAKQIDSVQLIIIAMEDITSRMELEGRVADYTRGLEIKITSRTKELESRVKELERMNKIMVGREMKMIELKAELLKLKKSGKKTAVK